MSAGDLRPNQEELVAVARQAFVDELLPLLPPDQRLTGLMVANALGIAHRMLTAPLDAPSAPAKLCAEIRAGLHDADDDGALRTHLIGRTLARLAVSNPKALSAAERSLRWAGRS